MKKANRFTSGAAFLIAILIVSVSCSKNSPLYGTSSTGNKGGQPGANEVWIQGMAFNPASVTVTAGTTIKWTNKDSITHTVTADDNSFDSGNIAANGTFSHTFSSAGTFTYHCKIHPNMTASV
jgi:plastocyanin